MSPTNAPTILLTLPEEHRVAFKEPFGPVYTDPTDIIEATGRPIVTVGDVVTYHFEQAGYRPQLAVVDGLTKRDAVDQTIRKTLATRPNQISVPNPAGTITAELLDALLEALAGDAVTTIDVEGEEDLATVPAVLAATPSTTVVYGQPDAGMVAIQVQSENQGKFRDLLDLLEGDHERVKARLNKR